MQTNDTHNVPSIIKTNNKITVYDAPMSYGKTNDIIADINNNPDNFYCVFTPLMSEVSRYIKNCPEIDFVQPTDEDTTKTIDLEDILQNSDKSVVASHAMFDKLSPKMLKAINYKETSGKRVLIMDETLETVKNLGAAVSKNDIQQLLTLGMIAVGQEDKRVTWIGGVFDRFTDVRIAAENEQLYLINDSFFIFEIPLSFIECFDKVVILTYMFEGSIMYHYFKYYETPFKYVDIDKEKVKALMQEFRELITLMPTDQLGFARNSLSKTHYNLTPHAMSDVNVAIKGIMKSSGVGLDKTLFTFYTSWGSKQTAEKWLKYRAIGRVEDCNFEEGCRNSFLSHTVRATNEYSHKELMVYCIKKYPHVGITSFFSQKGAPMNINRYALSEMLQWIFRGCIRERLPMQVAILNPVMRELMSDWLDERFCLYDFKLTPSELKARRGNYETWLKKNPLNGKYTLGEFIEHGAVMLNREIKKEVK